MKKERGLTQESFDRLLGWLDGDRERAGEKYQSTRLRLIAIFASRGCREAEDLADETINRVTLKLSEIIADYVGDPALYFYGVANKVYQEYLRESRRVIRLPPTRERDEDEERVYECLESCMESLPTESRALIVEYYRGDKSAKIEHRKTLAAERGIALNALRIRAHRIRLALQACVEECLARKRARMK
jgi:DNA-directed RNA polymerase specialized sigma24 family protein